MCYTSNIFLLPALCNFRELIKEVKSYDIPNFLHITQLLYRLRTKNAAVSLFLNKYTNALLNQFLATQTQPGVNYSRAASLVCNDYKIESQKSSPVRKVQGQPEIL